MEDISTPFHTGDNKPEEKPLEATPAQSEPVKVEEKVEEKPLEAAPFSNINEPVPPTTNAPVDLAAAQTADPSGVDAPPAGIDAPVAAPTGTVTAATANAAGALPEELKGWNWGAFFLTWIWAIGNQTWIGLLALISPLSLIMSIVLGIKGNEWAWQNRKFESVDQFKAVQKAWTKWGLIIFIVTTVAIIGILVATVTAGLNSARLKANDAKNAIPINLTQ